MIVNGEHLLQTGAMRPMLQSKDRLHGVSYGLSEAGYDIRIKQAVTLHPLRRFALASTVECFAMPDDLVAVVHDKSTWIRRGLLVGNSVAEPGWCGWLTLELFYFGWRPLHIPAGAGIAQVLFHDLSSPARYAGKYQNQADMPVPAILEA